MDQLIMPAQLRSVTGKPVRSDKRRDLIPAVLYGHGVKNVNLQLDERAFQQIYRQAGSSSLIDLVIDQQAPVKVLIHDIQRHPTRTNVQHVDFYQVKMTEKLEADIELRFTGESTAVKEQGGILVRAVGHIRVSCLPTDLVPAIDVDIRQLKTFEDVIKIKDLALPVGLEILDDLDTIVATVTPPRSEEELKELEGAVTEDVGAVEKVETKEEPAVGEEVAPPAPGDKTEKKKD